MVKKTGHIYPTLNCALRDQIEIVEAAFYDYGLSAETYAWYLRDLMSVEFYTGSEIQNLVVKLCQSITKINEECGLCIGKFNLEAE